MSHEVRFRVGSHFTSWLDFSLILKRHVKLISNFGYTFIMLHVFKFTCKMKQAEII